MAIILSVLTLSLSLFRLLVCVGMPMWAVFVWVLMYAYHLHINYAHWTINQNSQAARPPSVRFVNTCICHQPEPGSPLDPQKPLTQSTALFSHQSFPLRIPLFIQQLSLIAAHGGDSLSSDLHKSSRDSLEPTDFERGQDIRHAKWNAPKWNDAEWCGM